LDSYKGLGTAPYNYHQIKDVTVNKYHIYLYDFDRENVITLSIVDNKFTPVEENKWKNLFSGYFI
jgi:hypothetical protein